jgi:hypothetical protein
MRLGTGRRRADSFDQEMPLASPRSRNLPITIDLPSPLLREIGRIVVRHAALELQLNLMIYQLLEIDAAMGRITVRDPRTSDRLDMIADLLEMKKIKVRADLPAIRTSLQECASGRDLLAHGIWVDDNARPGKVMLRTLSGRWTPDGTTKLKRRIQPEGVEYDVTKARQLTALIEATGERLHDLGVEIRAALASSRGKSL